jgi:hypothetical protein
MMDFNIDDFIEISTWYCSMDAVRWREATACLGGACESRGVIWLVPIT